MQSNKEASPAKSRIVIVGAGFGGLAAARSLDTSRAEIILIDRVNHHLFQPLLYQVATAALSPSDIATATRAGKGVGIIIPNLLDWPDSLVVLDVKRENYENTAGYVAATVDDGDDALPFTLGEVYRQFAAGDAQKRFPKIISERKRRGRSRR